MTTLTPEEEAVRIECFNKLKRSSTLPVRVVVDDNDAEGRFTARAFAQVYAEQGRAPELGKQPARERLILAITASSAMSALCELRDKLG